jgi:hypothetical protein
VDEYCASPSPSGFALRSNYAASAVAMNHMLADYLGPPAALQWGERRPLAVGEGSHRLSIRTEAGEVLRVPGEYMDVRPPGRPAHTGS